MRSEKPSYPIAPNACPQCGCRWYWLDDDGDWTCFHCGRTLVLWSVYHRALHRWKLGNEARAENGYARRGRPPKVRDAEVEAA